MSWHSFNTSTHLYEISYLVILDIFFTKILIVQCFFYTRSIKRYHFCYRINLTVRKSQRTSNVSDSHSRRKSSKRYDLCYLILSVFTLNVFYNLFASVVAKIYIKIGHRDSFRIKESLKQEIKCYRIYVGNTYTKCNKAACSRSSPRSNRNITLFCECNEITHDKEISVEAHFINNG